MSMNILNDISQIYMEQVASKPDFLDLDKDGNKKEPMKKASKEVEAPKERLKTDRNMFSIPKGEQEAARERLLAKARAKREKMKEEIEIDEASYSAKEARAGKDIGKPGKQFAKIAKSAAERYGSEERGKKVAGAVLAKLRKEGLDPVGQEDADIDNDGDTDKSDKYLHNRRKAVGKAIAKKSVKESSYYDPMDDDDFDHDEAEKNRGVSGKNNPKGGKALGKKKKNVKEGFSNWRQDLSEVMDDIEANKEIKEKKVNNKIKINPEMKEAVEQLGGELVEMVELDEKTLTSAETKKKEEIVKSMKKKSGDFENRYPGRGKEVMYATATKMAKKVAEETSDSEMVIEKDEKIEAKFKGARTPFLLDKFRKEHPGSRQEKKKRGAKETPKERQSRLTNRQVERAVKYGLTKKEKGETQGREKYYSSRD